MSKKRIIKIIVICMVIAMTSLVYTVSAGSSLLSPGESRIPAGSSFDFSLDLSSLEPSEEEEAAGFDYNIALSIDNAIESFTVAEGVGSINAVSGVYTVNYSELGGDNKLNFVVTPSADITDETTYTVSVSITGGKSDSDKFTFKVIPIAAEDDSGESELKPDGNTEQTVPEDMAGNSKNQPGKMGKAGGSPSGGTASGTSSSSSSVTYAGSWDNYLDDLYVDGYEFTQKFNKTRDTYFIQVPDTVNSLNVYATASDSSASVDVAGNSDLTGSRCKIMVNVTADDGSVRVYRIYADRVSDKE